MWYHNKEISEDLQCIYLKHNAGVTALSWRPSASAPHNPQDRGQNSTTQYLLTITRKGQAFIWQETNYYDPLSIFLWYEMDSDQ